MTVEYAFDCQHISGLDEYQEHCRGLQSEAVQLSAGPLSMAFDSFNAGDLILTHIRFDRDAIFRSARDAGWHCFALDLSPKLWCGMDLPAGSLRTIGPRRETVAISHVPWDSISINIRHDTLAAWGTRLSEPFQADLGPEQGVYATDPGAVARFAGWVEALFAARMPAGAGADTALWIAALRAHVRQHLAAMLGCPADPTPVSSIHRVARYDLALAALRVIHRQDEDRTTVTDVARALGVGTRAVEYAFAHVVGVSPARYMLAERLNRARHCLRIGIGSVTSIAFEHQFENLSRFAQQYARLFGERPSDTLRAARQSFHGMGSPRVKAGLD
ncbi:helix-turn-helix transcriptional regulator [Vineibacter terrae]|nr:AraC family transcriptional regulator [Vineibacter terrae]